ncbi:MAG: M23 family metallopeptidase [Elainellaceae cyanobacterium]|jgi:murein DD-endopeptidase MepM/ murein hydrolase activator NlpD
MQPKFVVRSRHFAIAFIFGLVLFLVAGTHQSMVRALAPSSSAAAVLGQQTSALPIIEPMLPASATWSSFPTSNHAVDQQLHASAQTSSAQPRAAISTQPLTVAEAANVQQVEPSQVAMSDWLSASFPVEDFQTYTSPFGYRGSPTGGYNREFHYGLDLAAPEGSYIRSWWSGEVVEVSDDSNCGTSVVIESGPWLHIYCHMQGYVESDGEGRYMSDRSGGLQIREGQTITAGSRIGRVGMTGRTTGPHLHWGLKYDNSWVDPALVLRAMYASQQTASR